MWRLRQDPAFDLRAVLTTLTEGYNRISMHAIRESILTRQASEIGVPVVQVMRMVGTLLAEQDDEWQVADRRYFTIGSMARVDELEGGEDPKELLAAIA